MNGDAEGASPARRTVRAWLLVPLLALFVLIVGILYVYFRPFAVDGPSMEPFLRSGDRVLVKPGYTVPRRGDIVVAIGYPTPDERLVKRVIALPGDTVQVRDDVAYVQGGAEQYAFPVVLRKGPRTYSTAPVTVREGTVFLMGDNRPASLDSRDFGTVPLEDVQGRVVAIFFPLTRAGKVDYGTRD